MRRRTSAAAAVPSGWGWPWTRSRARTWRARPAENSVAGAPAGRGAGGWKRTTTVTRQQATSASMSGNPRGGGVPLVRGPAGGVGSLSTMSRSASAARAARPPARPEAPRRLPGGEARQRRQHLVDVGRGGRGVDLETDLLVAARHHRVGEAGRADTVGLEVLEQRPGLGGVAHHQRHHRMLAGDGLVAEADEA